MSDANPASELLAEIKRIITNVDVLIQLAETFYLMGEQLYDREFKLGGRTFRAVRHALGFEIVARLYRLLDTDTENYGFSGILNRLGTKSTRSMVSKELGYKTGNTWVFRNELQAEFDDIRSSEHYGRVLVFRHRFVGHYQKTPTVLRDGTVASSADVQNLQKEDVQFVIDATVQLTNKLNSYFKARQFNPETYAELARQDAEHFLSGNTSGEEIA